MSNVTDGNLLNIEVVYANSNNKEEQAIIQLQVAASTSIRQAIAQSGILHKFPNIDLEHNKVGVFGEIKDLSVMVKEQDRIEIYRDLYLNPNIARIMRVKV